MSRAFTFNTEVNLRLRDIPDTMFRAELNDREEILRDLRDEMKEWALNEVSLSDFDTDELVEELARRKADGDWTERVYRLLAQGDCPGAMDIMHRELGLAPPSHERAIADLLSGRKGATHVQSQ